MNSGLMVLIITLVAFVAMGVYLVTYGRKLVYPEGLRSTLHVRGIEVLVIDSAPRPIDWNDRNQCIRYAVQAAHQQWLAKRGRDMADEVPELVIQFSETERRKGVQSYVKGRIGKKRVPLAIVRFDQQPTPKNPGTLIHELAHVFACFYLEEPDSDHNDPVILDFETLATTDYLDRALYRSW